MTKLKQLEKELEKIEKLHASMIKVDPKYSRYETQIVLWRLENLKSEIRGLKFKFQVEVTITICH